MNVQLENYDLEKEEWAVLVEQYRALKRTKAKLDKDLATAKLRLDELCDGRDIVEQDGLKMKWVCPKGQVDWRTIPEIIGLSEQYIDSFRKESKGHYLPSFY